MGINAYGTPLLRHGIAVCPAIIPVGVCAPTALAEFDMLSLLYLWIAKQVDME